MWGWATLLFAGLVLEIRALRGKGVTLTSTTRRVYRVHTPPGRVAFIGSLAWFAVHILHKKAPRSE